MLRATIGTFFAVCFVVALLPTSACFSVCFTCVECSIDEDCDSDETCNEILGVCEPRCDAHDDCGDALRCDFESNVCADGCTADDDCDQFFVCDLDDRLCVRDACVVDDDCELTEAPRCDAELGFCVPRRP
jgi:hypothetical protein